MSDYILKVPTECVVMVAAIETTEAILNVYFAPFVVGGLRWDGSLIVVHETSAPLKYCDLFTMMKFINDFDEMNTEAKNAVSHTSNKIKFALKQFKNTMETKGNTNE